MEFVSKDVKYPYRLWTVQEPTDTLFLFYHLLDPPAVQKVGNSGFTTDHLWQLMTPKSDWRLTFWSSKLRQSRDQRRALQVPRAAPDLCLNARAGWRCAGDSHLASTVRTPAGFPSLRCWQSVSCPDISLPGWTDNKLGNFHHLSPEGQVGKLSESTS